MQNIGVYGGGSGAMITNSKSRNMNTGTFKTTASISSTKAVAKSLISPQGHPFEGPILKNPSIKAS